MITKPKTAIVVAGPTAVGKTAAAIRLALRFDTEIVSADSRQCYRELRIGVARPSDEELAIVPHHFIASHGFGDDVTAAVFERYALDASERILHDRDHVVVVGGTGLYLKAFIDGMDDMPDVAPAFRDEAERIFREEGLEAIRDALEKEDPLFSTDGDMANPHRMIRALSFKRATGASIRNYQLGTARERPFRIVRIGLELPREELHRRIEARVDEMAATGLLQEVEGLIEFRSHKALQTVGYREIFSYMDGEWGWDEAVDLVRQNTRRYAKRQMTWFRSDDKMHWCHPGDIGRMVDLVVERPVS
jgi:tRNA dimethylallyltransferase